MGYYLNVLRKGEMYQLEGQKLLFLEKILSRYYFYTCKMDEWDFRYKPTNEKISFTADEIVYLKRFQDEPTSVGLRKIGRDKVSPKN